MIFSQEHVDNFKNLSWDRSDLHWNASYARRAQFGEPIVHGIASLLVALGRWAEGRNFQLKSVHAELKGPVLVGREIDFSITSDGEKTTVLILDGNSTLARFAWAADFCSHAIGWPRDIDFAFSDSPSYLEQANSSTPAELTVEDYEYSLNGEYIRGLSLFGLKPGQIPLSQLQFLLWTSYFVGMHYPGRQALYSSLKVEFRPEAEDTGRSITLRKVTGKLDVGFGFARIQVAAPFLESATIAAFRRPEPVDYPLSEIRKHVTSEGLLKGLDVFVSGSSRGFGSVLAKSAALMGARLCLHSRTESEESKTTLGEIRDLSPESRIYYSDLTRTDETKSLARQLIQPASPQWIVLSASPRIQAKHFADQSAEEFHDFVLTCLRMTAGLIHELLPNLTSGSKVLMISSVYVHEAPRGFTHYVAAKCALEGLVKSLARERADLQFFILRLPRMLTDQTASPFSRIRTLSPIPIAVQMIERVMTSESPTNVHVLDYQPGPPQRAR